MNMRVCTKGLMHASLFCLYVFAPDELRAQEHSPHPFAPILQPIVSTPEKLTLSEKESQILLKGKPVVRQSTKGQAGSGIAVQDIDAPAEYVWKVILSHDRYGEWVSNIDRCHVYKKVGRLWYIDMLTSFLWFKSQLYMIHRIQRPMGYISWTLDRSRTSDLQDVTGYWRITPFPGDSSRTRLEYGSQLVAGNAPDFVIRFLTRDSLLDGTAWVKKQSEAVWQTKQR
jgi:hypothetical protein